MLARETDFLFCQLSLLRWKGPLLMKPFFSHKCFNSAATETDRCVPCPSAHATKIRSLCFHSASSWLRKSTLTCVHALHRIVLLMSSVCSPQHPQKSLCFGNVQHFTNMSNFSSGSHFASNLFIPHPPFEFGCEGLSAPAKGHWCEV